MVSSQAEQAFPGITDFLDQFQRTHSSAVLESKAAEIKAPLDLFSLVVGNERGVEFYQVNHAGIDEEQTAQWLVPSGDIDGYVDHFVSVRGKHQGPLIWAAPILDEYQVVYARTKGADSVLLNSRDLDLSKLQYCLEMAREYDMEPFVVVQSEELLTMVLQSDAKFLVFPVCVNKRQIWQKVKIDAPERLVFDLEFGGSEQRVPVGLIESQGTFVGMELEPRVKSWLV